MSYAGETRFRPDAAADFARYRGAAKAYAKRLARPDRRGFRHKPLDWGRGHPSYFTAMFQLLAALQALRLAPGARILEVGSGAGWATEIMAALAYRLTCIEPSADMARVARRRVRRYLRHFGIGRAIPNVSWRIATIEECDLPPGQAHAAIFFESLHHVIDERAALTRTFAALSAGGQIAILGDSNWIPGNREQEVAWTDEMAAYDTLESPFTANYLVWLLGDVGFVDIRRHHLLASLTPVDEAEAAPAAPLALLSAHFNNLVIARKPGEAPAPDLRPPPWPQRLRAWLSPSW